MRFAFASFVAFVAAGCAVTAGENSDQTSSAIQEGPSYQQTIDTVVNPYCQSHGTFGKFSGVAGVPIAYGVWPQANERGAIVLVPGRTETFLKYCELVYDLRSSGYSIYAMDLRGQGLSGRMLPDPEPGYVAEFSDYATDLDTFTRTIVKATAHPKMYLLAHSLGGATASYYLEQHQNVFNAAALSSPMIEINTAPYAEWEAYSITLAASGVGLGASYVLGHGPWDPNETFAANDLTHSQDRWTMNHLLWLAHPEVVLGAPTNQWMHESIAADWQIRGLAAYGLTTPTILFQAGSDQVVVTSAQDELCSKAPHCTKVAFPGTYHELLQETDDVRNQVIAQTLGFFAAH
jgi:lysophospholipase